FQAEDGIRDDLVTGVQTCALPIYRDGRNRNGFGFFRKRVRFALPVQKRNYAGGDQDEERGAHQNLCPACRSWAEIVRPAVFRARSEERRVGKECRGGAGAREVKNW